MSEENNKQFYISEGFAHGFLVLSNVAKFSCKVTDFYHQGDEGGLAWNDPEIGISWPKLGVYRVPPALRARTFSTLSSSSAISTAVHAAQ